MSAVNKKNIRSNKEQIKYLCQHMTLNPEFAGGEYQGPLGARQNEAEWVRLKEALDELGPQRTVAQWKVCWRDQKRKARMEGGAHSRATNATGNNIEVPEISENTALVLSAIGPEMAVGMGPDESPIGLRLEEIPPPPPPPAQEPAGTPRQPPVRAPSQRPARRNRIRRTLPPEQFLNAQLELNQLIRELITEVRRSNELRKEHLNLIHRLQDD